MNNNPFSLKGKTILITGASSGIGRTTAIECSKLGANLILTGRDEERLNSTLSNLMHDGLDHKVIVADLLDENSIKELVDNSPQIDGLFCNAGVTKRSPLKFYSGELFDYHYKINVLSPMLLIKQLLRKKRLNNSSSIVFSSSIGGVFVTSNGSGMYGSSKAALNSYMKYCALELGERGIRCNAVNPGMIQTGLISISDEEMAADLVHYPLKRYGETTDVAHGVIYLLSDASKWVTGIELKIDGGRSLK